MSFLGVLHRIGDKVGQYLLQATRVERHREGIIRIILQEGHLSILYALC